MAQDRALAPAQGAMSEVDPTSQQRQVQTAAVPSLKAHATDKQMSIWQTWISSCTPSRQPAAYDPQLQRQQTMEDKLSFYHQHFTKPIDTNDTEKHPTKGNRKFTFLSRGAIVVAIMLLLILLAIIGAAVGVTLTREGKRTFDPESPNAPANPHGPSPIRQALLDNFPDPTLWRGDDGTWYAYATNNAAGILHRPDNASSYEYGASNIQIATSPDFINWTLLSSRHDPLPTTGNWVAQGFGNHTIPAIPRANVWAPSVIKRKSDKKLLLYYTAARNRLEDPEVADAVTLAGASELHHIAGKHPVPHCLGASLSDVDSPMGPFEPMNTTFACQMDMGGAIDASAFYDRDDTLYVLYKIDGNNVGRGGSCGNMVEPQAPTPILLQRMDSSGLTADGEPVEILDRIHSDGPLVEAPELIRTPEEIYFLFFSSGCTRENTYNVKYATSKNIEGPYERAEKPLLASGMWGLKAPGSVGVHEDGVGGWNMAFHARVKAPAGQIRSLFTTKLHFEGRTVRMVRDELEQHERSVETES